MVVVCQQPNYFPWLGYLEQCARADVLIVLDSVQWIRQGRQHRVRILPHQSQSEKTDFQWLTLPVLGHGHREKPLRELKLDPTARWAHAHWRTLQTVYGRAPFFRSQLEPLVRPWLESLAGRQPMLCEVAIESMRLCFEWLPIKPHVLRSSDLPEQGKKSERLLSLCQAVGADTYYSGRNLYLDAAAFRAAGVRVVWQHWKHPEYRQAGRDRCKTHLSILDALAQAPLDEVKSWLEPKSFGPLQEKTP